MQSELEIDGKQIVIGMVIGMVIGFVIGFVLFDQWLTVGLATAAGMLAWPALVYGVKHRNDRKEGKITQNIKTAAPEGSTVNGTIAEQVSEPFSEAFQLFLDKHYPPKIRRTDVAYWLIAPAYGHSNNIALLLKETGASDLRFLGTDFEGKSVAICFE